MDGDLVIIDCLANEGSCQQRMCGVSQHWLHLQDQIQHILESITLADWCEEPIHYTKTAFLSKQQSQHMEEIYG